MTEENISHREIEEVSIVFEGSTGEENVSITFC